MSAVIAPISTQRITAADARIQDLVEVLEQQTRLSDYPHASAVRDQVLVYDARALRGLDDDETVSLETEIARALRSGPGIVVFAGAFAAGVVDRATTAFEAMIHAQRASGTASGDHFAKPGANDRVWNALEKLAVAAPDVFVDYYANEVVALAAVAGSDPHTRSRPRSTW